MVCEANHSLPRYLIFTELQHQSYIKKAELRHKEQCPERERTKWTESFAGRERRPDSGWREGLPEGRRTPDWQQAA